MVRKAREFSVAAAQPGNVVVMAFSKADALRRAQAGEGFFEEDAGADTLIRGTVKSGIAEVE